MVRSTNESGVVSQDEPQQNHPGLPNHPNHPGLPNTYQHQYQHYSKGRGRFGSGERRPRPLRPFLQCLPPRPSPEMDKLLTRNGGPPQEAEQMYIISGPFTNQGQCTVIAYPIPRGATVIATPSVPPPVPQMPVYPMIGSPVFNPDARPFFPPPPKVNDSQPADQSSPKPGIRSPAALVWNAQACPEGRVVPLRQMQPPVYFYPIGQEPTTTPVTESIDVKL